MFSPDTHLFQPQFAVQAEDLARALMMERHKGQPTKLAGERQKRLTPYLLAGAEAVAALAKEKAALESER